MTKNITLNILHVEDDCIDAEIIKNTLTKSQAGQSDETQYIVDRVSDLSKALVKLSTSFYDAILLDMNLPDGSGMGNVRDVKSIAPDVAIIIVTSAMDDDLAVNALHEGAQEFITKDYCESPLLKSIIRSSIMRKAAEVELSKKAHYDFLTNLPNRMSFETTVKSMLERAKRWDRKEALMFIDLDKFKPVNDKYGHEAGNIVLKEVASRLRHTMRGSDLIARYGGDEFIIYLDGSGRTKVNHKNCMVIAQKIITALKKPIYLGDTTLEVGASIGIAIYPDAGTTFEALIKNADAAMYEAKSQKDAIKAVCRPAESDNVKGFVNHKRPLSVNVSQKSQSIDTQLNQPSDVEGQAKTLLIIDDSVEDRIIYKSMLNLTGQDFIILEAGTIREGERLIDKHKPDCILLDNILPDMRGNDFLAKLKAQNIPLHSGIVMITGQEDRYLAIDALKNGAKDYLVKGEIEPDRFLQIINSAIEQSRLEKTLYLYQEELERSNQDLSEFAYTVAHDLKSPMRKVISFCHLLNDMDTDGNAFDEKAQHCIDRISISAERMQNLISSLLVLANMSHAKEKRQQTDLNTLSKKVLGDLGAAIQEYGADVRIENLETLLLFPVRFEQILKNLIGNGLKYSADGVTPQICVKGAYDQSDNPSAYIISIQDNGVGIPKRARKNIFKPFKRLHSADEIEGSGLGLSICQKAVDKHNGKIWVESQEGVGSTFFVEIPFQDKKVSHHS